MLNVCHGDVFNLFFVADLLFFRADLGGTLTQCFSRPDLVLFDIFFVFPGPDYELLDGMRSDVGQILDF